MELVAVEIQITTYTSQYGALSAGEILRTSPEFAKHLVEDAGAAKYVKAAAKAEAKELPAEKPAPKSKGK
jgi:hypothetical protein